MVGFDLDFGGVWLAITLGLVGVWVYSWYAVGCDFGLRCLVFMVVGVFCLAFSCFYAVTV